MEQLRAVTYNRCSTEEESQKDALAKQVQEAVRCVYEQGWNLVDTYVEAKSGTTVRGRSEYNRLCRDMERGVFDVIVIKSQDRLMRNTKDWYLFLDRMQQNGKKLYMYLEGKFYTPDDALITGIKAILAEEYSRELSKKINNAHKNRQREGKRFVFTNHMYGLKKLPDKSIVIDEREAEMIRMIFQLSANGYGTHSSAKILCQSGYTNRNGKMLSASVIRNIIRNPIYMGTVVQNKHHYEFEHRHTVRNPETEWIVHENAVPAIVNKQMFEIANRALDDRRREGKCGKEHTGHGVFLSHELSGRLVCGLCGAPFYRTVRHNKQGAVAEWKCSNYLHNGRRKEALRRDQIRKSGQNGDAGCDNVHLDEKRLLLCLEQVCGQRGCQREQEAVLEQALSLLREALPDNDRAESRERLAANIRQTEERRDLLLEKLLEGVIDNSAYQRKNRELQDKIHRYKGQIRRLEEDLPHADTLEERLAGIKGRLEREVIGRAQAEEIIARIEGIAVYPERMEIFLPLRSASDTMLVTVPQGCSTSHVPMMEAEKERVLALMREKPEITAKKIAEKMGVNLSLVRRRIRSLKAEGKIVYMLQGGGKWRVMNNPLDFSD